MRIPDSSSSESAPVFRVLLVDDHCQGLAARKCVLEEAGYRIATATSAADAIEKFTAGRFDVVVTDYKMPRMNGIDLIQKLRKQNNEIPVVLISGFADALGLTEHNTGADIVIQKSANEVTHLLRAVARLLRPKAVRKAPRKPAAAVEAAPKTQRKSA